MNPAECKSAIILVALAGVIVGLVELVGTTPSAALPDYASKTGQACATCHVNPAGGGPLTAIGQAFEAIGTHATDPAGAWAQVVPNLSTSAKTVSSTSASPGQALTYTIFLTNTGAVSATARLTDTVPLSVTYVSGSATGGATYVTATNSITWTGVVTAGSALSLTYSAVITSPLDNGTLITNTATINDGVNPALETAPVTTTISSSPNLAASAKGVSAATASPGQVLTYTLTLTNTGDMNASARITDTLPVSLAYVTGSASGGATYDETSRSIGWTGVLSAGSVLSLTYSAVITSPPDKGTLITNTATIYDGVNIPFETAPVTTTVTPTVWRLHIPYLAKNHAAGW